MNRRDRRAAGRRGKVVDLEPVKMVIDSARLAGCTCDPPSVHFLTGPMRYGEVGHVRLGHDDGCPLVNGVRRLTAIVVPNPEARS